MESLKALAFTKGNKLLDIWQRVALSNDDVTSNQATVDPSVEEEILLLQKNSDINKEAYLFHLLNQFIILFNNRDKSDISELIDHDNRLQRLLRYGLLKYLREWDTVSLFTNNNNNNNNKTITINLRRVLYHWWMEILNNLKCEHRNNHSLKLDISLLTTLMECLNRIMNLLVYIPLNFVSNAGSYKIDYNDNDNDNSDELNNYCKHLLLTCHYITYQLKQNSKSNFIYVYLKQFNDLLYDQLGLINALAFVYFPDRFNYNLLVINLLTRGKFKIVSDYNDPLLPWRKKNFKRIRNFPQKKHSISLTTTMTNSNNISCFRIIISYLQEEKTFRSFTYHYWRLIILIYQHYKNYADERFHRIVKNNVSFLNMVNSSEIIVYYTVHKNFIQDIERFKKITKHINNNKNNNNNNNIQFNKFINYFSSNKSIEEFLEKKFQMLLIWKRPLNELFIQFKDTKLLYSILLYYDQKQLECLKRVSLYDTPLTNLIFNKFFSALILEIYKCGEFVNWHLWNQTIIDCINTGSFENRINILKFLFNTWEYLPKENQSIILKQIITMNNEMLITFQHSHINILIIKLIIFKILPGETGRNLLISYLLNLETTCDQLTKNQRKVMNSKHNDRHPDSLLLFDNNRKYVITHKKVPINDDFKNPYIVIDKEFNESTRNRKTLKDLDDNEMTKFTNIEKSNNQKVIAVFKNIIMPYNKNQQYDVNRYNDIWGNSSPKVHEQLDNDSNKTIMKSNKILTFDLSVYKIDDNIVMLNNKSSLLSYVKNFSTGNNVGKNNETLLIHLRNFINTFNLTMIEYYDFISLYNEDDIRIEV